MTAVYAAVLSEEALDALRKHRIHTEYDTLVPRIANRAGDGLCPMETAVGIDDPAEARRAIERKLAELSAAPPSGAAPADARAAAERALRTRQRE